MKKARKILCLALCLVMTIGVLAPVHSEWPEPVACLSYEEYEKWVTVYKITYEDEVYTLYKTKSPETAAQKLYELGLFRGTGTDTNSDPIFDLDKSATRHEAIVMLIRLLGKESEANNGDYSHPFTDVAPWASPYVAYAYENNLTTGVSSASYNGNAAVNATQYLTFVLRALGYSSDTDFAWNRAWELSDEIGLTGGEYNAEATTFLRGDMAVISYNALSAETKDGALLFDVLLEQGVFDQKPEPEPADNYGEIDDEFDADAPDAWRPGIKDVARGIVYKNALAFDAEKKELTKKDLVINIYYPTKQVYEVNPLVVFYYGGGWTGGWTGQQSGVPLLDYFTLVMNEMRSRDYTVALVEYRLAVADKFSSFPAAVEDIIDSLLFFRKYSKKYNIDPDAVSIVANSAGAHLSMLAAYGMETFSPTGKITDVRCLVSVAGPTKFYGDEFKEYSGSIGSLLGGVFNEDDLIKASPYYYLENASESLPKIPALFVHDKEDDVVPFSQSEVMLNKSLELGIDSELFEIAGVKHQIYFHHPQLKPSGTIVVKAIADFIDKHSAK